MTCSSISCFVFVLVVCAQSIKRNCLTRGFKYFHGTAENEALSSIRFLANIFAQPLYPCTRDTVVQRNKRSNTRVYDSTRAIIFSLSKISDPTSYREIAKFHRGVILSAIQVTDGGVTNRLHICAVHSAGWKIICTEVGSIGSKRD